MTTPRAQRTEVPRRLRPDGPDHAASHYASAFALLDPDASSRTPEQWARAAFEDAPAPLRWFLVMGWTLVLGLRLGPRSSPGHVLGWPISDSGSASLSLVSRSGLITAHNIVTVDDSTVMWVTFVRFNRRLARPVWATVAPIHHLAIPYLLRRASRSRSRP